MDKRTHLDILDLELLAALQRERQAEMRQEARNAYLLRDQIPGGKEGEAMLKRKLVVALAAVVLIALWLSQLAAAAAGGGGGGGGIYLVM